jgi:invasion protein IalB
MASGRNRIILFIVIAAVLAGVIWGASSLIRSGSDKDTAQSAAVANQGVVTNAVPGKGVPSQQAGVWFKRCNDKAPTECEIFQRLVMKKSNMRLVEFALSPIKNKKGVRIAVILPLGITVSKGIALQVDDHPQQNVAIQSCDQNGCYARVNFPWAFLEWMESGSILNVGFLANAPKPLKIEMSLKGLSEQVAAIK